jgi:hypothetical protein
MRNFARVVGFDDEIVVSDRAGNRLCLNYDDAFDFSVELEFLQKMDEIEGHESDSYCHRGVEIRAEETTRVIDDIMRWLRRFRGQPKPTQQIDWQREGF